MKKILVILLSFMLGISIVACSKKEAVEEKNTTNGEVDYTEKYSVLYNDYLAKLRNYNIFDKTDETIEYYKNNEYPGNESYVQMLKDAYNDIKENIQNYINGINEKIDTTDKDLLAMNEKLVAEGKKTIENINKRLENLDKLPKEAYSKSKEEFIRVVNDATKIDGETTSEFNKVLEEINKKLNIDIKNNETAK
ncbi:MAG: hypothetical protein ACRC92_12260 [Peptostreptococcaceae bacterium]